MQISPGNQINVFPHLNELKTKKKAFKMNKTHKMEVNGNF